MENSYELFFPKKNEGLAIIWLYEKVKNGYFKNGVFTEQDIQQAFDAVSSLNRESRERNPWGYYNSIIMRLQEFFLYYDEEQQTYSFKDYGTYLCEKIFKMMSERFNPTVIETICTDLYKELKDVVTEEDISKWLEIRFDKEKIHLKEQIDYLNQQIDKSVMELSDKAKLKTDPLLTALRDIENKLNEISRQNNELRVAFREIHNIKTILINHPARENDRINENISATIDYFESVRISLNMVDSRINKIQPKIRQFFGLLNRRLFDTKVEKFFNYLLDKSIIVSGELVFPDTIKSFTVRHPPSKFTIVEERDGLFVGKRNPPAVYTKDAQKEANAYKNSYLALSRQSRINQWMEKIKREIAYLQEYDLSDAFFKILEAYNDLYIAVNVIYQTIKIYDQHEKWTIEIDCGNIIQKNNYAIWNIRMKRK
jgi:hypothetical protein